MYNARITRDNPTCFIILIDQSGSMAEQITLHEQLTTKANAVSYATNLLLSELVLRSKRDDGIRDYFDIAIIGYNGDEVNNLIPNVADFIKPSQLIAIDHEIKSFTANRILPNGDISKVQTLLPYWIKSKAEGSTPMYKALSHAYKLANNWSQKTDHKDSYPPTIFNITDGEATDSNMKSLTDIASKIKGIKMSDGNAILINIHIASTESDQHIIFPSTQADLPENKYTHQLFEMSSVMPSYFNENIEHIVLGRNNPPYRAMSYNTTIYELISMMNIGSMSINLIG